MKMDFEAFHESEKHLPNKGQYIIGQHTASEIIVYQAYKPSIAAFAVKHQYFGGSEYGYGRMSWIKPNFLWMMYRCGWAEKENQERVLAIWMDKVRFEEILAEAVHSSFNPQYYPEHSSWKQELENKEVRLQWDPDHDPYGNKLSRRAIQIGLKGQVLERFGKEWIKGIEDITPFVKEQKSFVDWKALDQLEVPVERVWDINNVELNMRLGVDAHGKE